MLDIRKTHEILNGYAMSNGELNEDYFTYQVEILAENTKSTYNLLKSKMKPLNVALCWVMHFINTELYFNGYRGYTCNLYHLKAYEKEHESLNRCIEALTEIVKEQREELKAE